MATKIKLRRGTAAEWTSANPTLEAGEAGVETDTRKIKIGNGSTAWNSLAYAAESFPTQTNNTGKVLSTNGTSASWVDPPSNRNLIINGAMNVHQRGTSGASVTNYVTADRWYVERSGFGNWTQSVETDAPTGSGFRKSWKILVDASAGAANANYYWIVAQKLEGQDVQRIKKGTSAAEQLTLSFWVKSNVTGTYVAELRDVDNSRGVSASYSVSASATWERKTITFPADTTGVLDNDNGNSLMLQFWFAAGSTFSGGSPLQTSWGTGGNTRATGQVNLGATLNNYWQVTGVQLETGPVATPFEFEPYETTLRKCQRYYQRVMPGVDNGTFGVGWSYNTGDALFTADFPVTMRVRPTALEQTGTAGDYRMISGSTSAITCTGVPAFASASPNAITFTFSVGSGLTAGQGALARAISTSAYLGWSAEL